VLYRSILVRWVFVERIFDLAFYASKAADSP
jgi:hypothetical protein